MVSSPERASAPLPQQLQRLSSCRRAPCFCMLQQTKGTPPLLPGLAEAGEGAACRAARALYSVRTCTERFTLCRCALLATAGNP